MNMMPMGMGASPALAMPSPEQLQQDKLTAEACSWEEISGILRSDDRRNYTIDIETDATAFEDAEVEKAQRIEYIKAMTEMMTVWIPAIQSNPTLAPFAKELAIFGSGAFKPGRQFEEQLGDAFDQIQNMPPQPNPEAEKLKGEMALKEKDLQIRMEETKATLAADQQKSQQEMLFKEREHHLKLEGQQADLAFKREEIALKKQELGLKQREIEFNHYFQQENSRFERQSKQEDRQIAIEDKQIERQYRERELGLKAEDSQHKRRDMDERRSADIQDKTERREMEASFMAGKVGKATTDLNQKVVDGEASRQVAARDSLKQEVHSVAERLAEQQMMIAQALAGLFERHEQTQGALLAAIKRIGAPRSIRRDPKTGKAIGVEILEEAGA